MLAAMVGGGRRLGRISPWLGLSLAASASAQVQPPAPPFLSYAAKIVCGTQRIDADVVRGVYASTINIHNPQATATVTFYKKAVIALPERSRSRGPISAFVVERLKPDEAMGVDCTDIKTLFAGIALPAHYEGFLVIEVPAPTGAATIVLDVIGKYTVRHQNTAGADQTISDANSIDVVPVKPQMILQ